MVKSREVTYFVFSFFTFYFVTSYYDIRGEVRVRTWYVKRKISLLLKSKAVKDRKQ